MLPPWVSLPPPCCCLRLEALVESGQNAHVKTSTANNPPAFFFPEVLHLITLIPPDPGDSLWNSCLELWCQVRPSSPNLGPGVQLGVEILRIHYKTKTSPECLFLIIKNSNNRDFPGGPVAKTPGAQCRGPTFCP